MRKRMITNTLMLLFLGSLATSGWSQVGLPPFYGDLNEDDLFDAADVQALENLLDQTEELNARETLLGDANNDSEVNAADLLYVIDIVEGRESPISIISSSQTVVVSYWRQELYTEENVGEQNTSTDFVSYFRAYTEDDFQPNTTLLSASPSYFREFDEQEFEANEALAYPSPSYFRDFTAEAVESFVIENSTNVLTNPSFDRQVTE